VIRPQTRQSKSKQNAVTKTREASIDNQTARKEPEPCYACDKFLRDWLIASGEVAPGTVGPRKPR